MMIIGLLNLTIIKIYYMKLKKKTKEVLEKKVM